jgi:sporulation protein YunB
MAMRRIVRIFLRFFLLLTLVCLVAFFLLRSRYNTVMTELARTHVTNSTSDLINDSVANQIASGQIAYDRIVYFEKDVHGKITALKTNIGEVNKLKTDTLNVINDEILAIDSSDIGVPLGSIILPELFSGTGPKIPVRILTIRNSDASFSSNFVHAGINQTLHQLIMTVGVDVSVLVLGRAISFTVSSEVVVAETVIIGDVPDTFLQTGG